MTRSEHLDVLIVGAGLSGIGAAYHLQERCPGKSYAILEARDDDRRHLGPLPLPGHPLGLGHVHARLPFRPWTEAKAIADGPSILQLRPRDGPRRRHRRQDPLRPPRRAARSGRAPTRAGRSRSSAPTAARRSSSPAASSSSAAATTATTRATRRSSPASSASPASVVHPQHWPEDIDYAGKRVVVIGSGATAVTLVPALAEEAAHVTMLQRSPTYVVSLPGEDRDRQRRCGACCPTGLAYRDRALEERAPADG